MEAILSDLVVITFIHIVHVDDICFVTNVTYLLNRFVVLASPNTLSIDRYTISFVIRTFNFKLGSC